MAVWPTHREKALAQRRRKDFLRKQARARAQARRKGKRPPEPTT